MRMNVRQRTALSPPSGVRASAWRAVAVVACAAVALVVSFLNPVYAYAADYQDVWNHQSIDGGQQYIVGAYNAYDAAAFVCGYSSSTVGGWDLPTLGKLSNAPAIVAIADAFDNVTPWNDDLLSDNCEQYFGSDLWRRMQNLYGGMGGIYNNPSGVNAVQLKYWQDNMPAGMHVYALNTTAEVVGAAKEAFRAILAGEDTGGGSSGGSSSFEFHPVYSFRSDAVSGESYSYTTIYSGDQAYTTRMDKDGNPYAYSGYSTYLLQSPFTVSFPEDVLPELPDGFTYDDLTYSLVATGNRVINFRLSKNSTTELLTTTTTSKNGVTYTFDYVNGTTTGGYYLQIHIDDCTVSASGMNVTNYSYGSSSNWSSISNSQDFGLKSGSSFGGLAGVGGGGGDEPEPPNNWPDNDTNTTVAPSPPELPTPKDPTTPTEPDPDPPYYYTPPAPDPPAPDPPYEPTEPTGTSPTDYTPWLRAILLALGGISSDLATHCQHLQAQMKAQATRIIQGINNQLVNLGTSINNAIGDWAKWLGDCWGEGLNTLTDNLYDLFHWLADQFDFTYSGDPYDDSGIIGWLRRIYNRLGSGGDPKHYAPTILDPGSEGEEEPFDFWAWLLERIAAILGGVLGGATDAVSTLLEGIRGKFPFSIPWDLLAFLGMLSGDRAIPVFTFTIPAIQGWWNEVPIRVDLTPYDSAAQACRTMVLIWWAFILAMKSTWMINDVLGALGSSIVSRFTGRLVGTAS